MKWKQARPLIGWQVLLAAIVAAGIVHIASTLSVPSTVKASAYKRLSTVLPANSMVVLPPTTPANQPLPYLPPDARLAVCRFDITDGPVAVSVTLPERGWLLTLHSSVGDVFYAAPGQEVRSMDVSIRIVPATERFLGLLPGGRSVDSDGTSISSPTRQGLAVLRAPVTGEAFGARIEKTLAQASCTLDKS